MIACACYCGAAPEHVSTKDMVFPKHPKIILIVLVLQSVSFEQVIVTGDRKEYIKKVRQPVSAHNAIAGRLAAGRVKSDTGHPGNTVTQHVVEDLAVVAAKDDINHGGRSRTTSDVEPINRHIGMPDIESLHRDDALRLEDQAGSFAGSASNRLDIFRISACIYQTCVSSIRGLGTGLNRGEVA